MKNRTKLALGAGVALLAWLLWPRHNEKQFAQQLAERIPTIVNEDPGKDNGTAINESKQYIDPDHQLVLTIDPMGLGGLFGSMFGGSSGMTGNIRCDKYETGLGELSGTLNWQIMPHRPENGPPVADYTVNRLTGNLISTKNDTVYVDYQYKVDYRNDKFVVPSVTIQDGAVKVSGKDAVKLP